MRLTTDLKVGPEPKKNAPKDTRKAPPEIDCSAGENGAAQSNEHSALSARATNDAVRDWDVKSGRLAWPQGLASLLGYAPSIASQDIGFWQRHVHPEDRARVAASIRDAFTDGERWSGEYRFRHADGNYLLLLERAFIARDDQGKPARFVGVLMDITARKQLQDQLLRSQKMEAFGQLASGVAHDFNNFLTTILGYSDLLLADKAIKGEVTKHIAEIRGAAGRAAALTSQLLAFSRRHPLDPRVLEANALITNLERSLLRLVGENISVECDLHHFKDGGYIKVDPGQMTQILLNLAVNARDAMSGGGKLILSTGLHRIHADAEPARDSEQLTPGDYLTISVRDTGEGMSDEVKSHLFEPFFTTKDGGQGSGLGLATSYGIIRQSGGQIRVQSDLGRGTTVTIYFPKLPAPPPPAYKKPNDKSAPTGTETILVVEDDIGVRHIAVRVLRSLGYHVIEAASGDDAQRLIAQDGPNIHLLLTDIVMPQMSGRHFAEWLHLTSPETKVLFISGYLEESVHPKDRPDESTFFLPKPFDTTQLALKVREVLDARS